MELIIAFMICNAFSVLQAVPNGSTVSPSSTFESKEEAYERKESLLAEWNEQVEQLTTTLDPLMEGKYEAKSCVVPSLKKVNNAESTSAIAKIVNIPNACTPEEMRQLQTLKRANKELKRLREEIELAWSRPPSPGSEYRRRMRIQPPRFSISESTVQEVTSENPDQRRARLEQAKRDLDWRMNYLERNIKYYQGVGWDRYEAGPCNGLGEGPSTLLGISMRMYRAMREGLHDNMCNLYTEIEREVDRISKELEGIMADSSTSVCESTTSIQSPI